MHDQAAHAHRAAALRGQGEHLSGHEQSRLAYEYSRQAHQQTQNLRYEHAEIAAMAHKLWEARGCPEGSAHEDWLHAIEVLRDPAYKR